MRTLTFAVLTLVAVGQVPSARAGTLFTSGPFSGNISAWDITNFTEADSFNLAAGDTVTGVNFAAWLVNSFLLQSVNWAILSAPTGGTTYASGTATPTQTGQFTDVTPGDRSFGFDIDSQTFSIPAWVAPTTGTYWLALSNAMTNGVDTASDTAYWDENDNPSVSAWSSFGGGQFLTSGVVGCSAPSCTQAFDITGDPAATAVPEPGSFALGAIGMVGIVMAYRRHRRTRD